MTLERQGYMWNGIIKVLKADFTKIGDSPNQIDVWSIGIKIGEEA